MGTTARVSIATSRGRAPALVVAGCFEREPPASARVAGAAKRRAGAGRVPAKGKVRSFGSGAGEEVWLGLGPRAALTADGLDGFVDRCLDLARQRGRREVVVELPEHGVVTASARRLLTRFALGGYCYAEYLEDGGSPPVSRVRVVPPEDLRRLFRREAASVRAVAEAIAWARDLGNTPPNVANPVFMAEQASSLEQRFPGLRARALGPTALRRMGMNGILAVGGGSQSPARLVRLEWGTSGPVIALVGKGVTFDTGGISIKPAAAMDEMKYDKCGACTVLGIVHAVCALELPVRLRAYLPFAENMPSGSAYRPSDIVRCYNGKTVEILNTDAEGRMILADALAWAAEERPDHLLEYSTLTGAAVVALGESGAAIYTPDDALAEGLLGAAGETGELLWRMPLWPCFVEEMKGEHADLKNSGGRWGGANTAAAFLSQFVDGHASWAHLDIAGPAMSKKPKGASGYGIAFTVEWLRALTAGDESASSPTDS